MWGSCGKQCKNLWILTTRTLCKIWRWRSLRPVAHNQRQLYLVGYWQPQLMNIKSCTDPSHPVSPLAKDEATWCTSPPPEIKQSDRYMLVVTSSVGQLNLGPGGDNARRSQSDEICFWNPWMLAMFPPPHGVIHYRGATLTELGE